MTQSATDFFAVMGLPRSLRLDPATLLQRYHALSREHHPDFHTQSDEQTRNASLAMSSVVNEAFRTLNDPFERARHLLALEWPDMSDGDRKRIPGALLFEIMEMQEAIADAATGAEPGELSADHRENLTSIRQRLADRMRRLKGDLDAFAESWDAAGPGTGTDRGRLGLLERLNELLNTRNYLRTLLATVDGALDGAPPGGAIRH